MAPRTRTRQRKERRKWMRNQQRLQQQNYPDREAPRGQHPSANEAKDTESQQLASTAGRRSEDESLDIENNSDRVDLHTDDNDIDNDDTIDDNNANQVGHYQLHPPDCLCTLRKQLRGKNFFLPPLSLASAMERNDDYCHLEASSAASTNRTR